jgi:hypothetical protein
LRDYTGVSALRLEILEERLKSDVIAEIDEFQGRVLLHTETAKGEVVPVWESIDKTDVVSVREAMAGASKLSGDAKFSFVRIPVTSESTPDVSGICRSGGLMSQFHDLTELLDLCIRTDLETSAFVLNDQLGRGRSSTTAVIMLLIQEWLRRGRDSTRSQSRERGRPGTQRSQNKATVPKPSWQIINSCLRVIRNGLEVKQVGVCAMPRIDC